MSLTEQLNLFPMEEPLSTTLEDDTETTEQEIIEILRSLGESFENAMDKRADIAVFNYLMGYGVPQRPMDVRHLIHQSTVVMMGWAAGNGYITFTDKAIATPEEVAAREVPESAFEEVPEDEATILSPNFGQYL